MQVPRDAMRLAERLISVVSDPYMIDGDQIEVGASIGISLAPDDSVDADELMRAADMALYYAKADRGSYSFFQPSMDKQVRDRGAWSKICAWRSPNGSSSCTSSRSCRSPNGR